VVRQLFRGGAFLTGFAVIGFLCATTQAGLPWSPPITLSYPSVNAGSPSVAISDTGAMVATWVRQEGSIYEVQASVNTNGIWSAPVNLSQSGQSAFESSVAIDNNGVATAVWTVGSMIQSSTFRFGPSAQRKGWSPPIALSEMSRSALYPRVVVDAAGNATAMWVRYDMNGAPGIETAHRPVSGNWTAPLLLAAGAPRALTLVVNARGCAAAIWDLGAFSSNTSIYVSTRPGLTPSGTVGVWSSPYNIAPPAYRQGGGRIGIAANGDVTACWRTNTHIQIADKPANANWGPTATIYTSNSLSAYPTLAVTASGDTMAAWTTAVFIGGSYNYRIGSAIRPVGGDWSVPGFLTSSAEYDEELHAGTTTSGACVLTWVDINSLSLKSSTWTVKKGWYDLATIASGSDTALAVGGDKAIAIWIAGQAQAQVSTAPIK
jgi:hypothetical protein